MNVRVHCIGNAHIDPVWLWRWPEGLQEVKATFRSALDRMKEHPAFTFTASSAAFYAWIEENDPEMFEEIRMRVDEGRWEIVGGWWVEPDANLPGGESFVRHALVSQRYFRAKFGRISRIGYHPDGFGHSAMLPQILAGSGIEAYCFMRPGPHEKALPEPVFWWEADDGSRVLAARIPFEYCTWSDELDAHIARCRSRVRPPYPAALSLYGVGNHGGGPTRENLASLDRAMAREDHGTALLFSSLERFFGEFHDPAFAIPTVHDELQHHARGCYSAHSGVKRACRQTENLLVVAEKFLALARTVTGIPYPAEPLRQAWKDLLFNQFHDILAGTSLPSAYEDADAFFGEATAIGARGLNQALQSLSWRIGIEPEEQTVPWVVFNPHAWEATLPVELETVAWDAGEMLVDPSGTPIPVQPIRSEASARGRGRVVFQASLPPLGWTVFRRKRRETGEPIDGEGFGSGTSLANARLLLEVDETTGHLRRLVDRAVDIDVLAAPAARAVVYDDPSDTWSHDISRFDRMIGEFTAERVVRTEDGPVRGAIRVESRYGNSRLVQEFRLYAGDAAVEVRVTIDWQERRKAVKLLFPLALDFREATYEIPYGQIVRPAEGTEEPGQSWIDVSGYHRGLGEVYGLSLLNDGKYSFSVTGREMAMTVLRSPAYAHHDPIVLDDHETYAVIDQGRHTFCYRIVPHRGDWRQAETVRRARELNQAARWIPETFHPGPLPQVMPGIAVEPRSVLLEALKIAEDDDRLLIVRIRETAGAAAEGTIHIPWLERHVPFWCRPNEIKTFAVPFANEVPAFETNLIEDPVRA